MIINTFISDSSIIAKIKIQHRQIVTTISNQILRFKPMAEIPIMTNHIFITVITFRNVFT